MKQMMLIALAMVTLGQSSFAARPLKPLSVNASSAQTRIQIKFQTVEMKSAICHMIPIVLNLELPRSAEDTGGQNEKGKITVTTETSKICLAALGRHSGEVDFERGSELPQLKIGSYILSINDEEYGTLVVDKDSVQIQD